MSQMPRPIFRGPFSPQPPACASSCSKQLSGAQELGMHRCLPSPGTLRAPEPSGSGRKRLGREWGDRRTGHRGQLSSPACEHLGRCSQGRGRVHLQLPPAASHRGAKMKPEALAWPSGIPASPTSPSPAHWAPATLVAPYPSQAHSFLRASVLTVPSAPRSWRFCCSVTSWERSALTAGPGFSGSVQDRLVLC